MKALLIIASFLFGMVLAACGAAPAQPAVPSTPETLSPTVTPTPTPSASPTPDPDAGLTTVRYTNFFNQNTICDALANWNENTTVYIFPRSSALTRDLIFKRGLVYDVLHGDEATSPEKLLQGLSGLVLHNNSPGCTLRFDSSTGEFLRVDP